MSEAKPDPRPDPFIPAFVDLRGMPWMPVDTSRLLDSDTFAIASGDEFKAAFTLWCKAWQQLPAGSLPKDDRILASWFSPATWRKVRETALRGFVECKDGRLYHRLICEKALEAWEFRAKQRAKAAKRWGKGPPDPELPGVPPGYPSGDPGGDPAGPSSTNTGGDAAAYPEAMQGTGTGTGTVKEEEREARARARAKGGPIGSAMVEAWQLPDAWRDWAVTAFGWDPKSVVRMGLKFRDHHLSKGTISKDWAASWRTWCMKEEEFRNRDSRRA